MQANPPLPEIGSVQSGPRLVVRLGRVTKASGPAWCSPLNGVAPVNPQRCASAGLLNRKPRWNVFVGGEHDVLVDAEDLVEEDGPDLGLAGSVRAHVQVGLVTREPDARVDVGGAAGGLRAVLDREQVEVQVRLEPVELDRGAVVQVTALER